MSGQFFRVLLVHGLLLVLTARALPQRAPITVTLLGTGNPRPTPQRYGPSILVEVGTDPPTRILIDAGRGAAERLFSLGGGKSLSGIDMVLLTHLHSDHVVGLPDLWLTGWIFGRAKPLQICGPQGTADMMAHLREAFKFDITMRRDIDEHLPAAGVETGARDILPDTAINVNGVLLIPFLVDHGPVAPAYGWRVEYGGRSVVLSGTFARPVFPRFSSKMKL